MFNNNLYVISSFYNATTSLHPKNNKGKEKKKLINVFVSL